MAGVLTSKSKSLLCDDFICINNIDVISAAKSIKINKIYKLKTINEKKNIRMKPNQKGNAQNKFFFTENGNNKMEDNMKMDIVEVVDKEVDKAGFKGFAPNAADLNLPNKTENKENKRDGKIKNYSNKYMPGDKGPYFVIIEKKGLEDMSIAEKLRSLNFGKIIQISNYGKNRIKVQTKDLDTANKILKSVDLEKLHGCTMFVPTFMVETLGYINKIPTSFDENALMNNIESDIKVTKIERMTRWNREESKIEPTAAIKITFRATSIPDSISIYGIRRRVSYYIPRPLICKNCLIYGHTKKFCRGKQKCFNCTEDDHVSENCKNKKKCYYCDEDHITNNFLCNEFKNQKKIKYLIITRKISYREASRIVKLPKNPEFNLYKENFPGLPNVNKDKQELEKIREDMKEMKDNLLEENNKLKKEITEIKKTISEINTINRKLQGTAQSYLNPNNEGPQADLVMTEVLQQLLDMDKTINSTQKKKTKTLT